MGLLRLYRAKVVEALERDLLEELQWLNAISLKYLKNYQIWFVHTYCMRLERILIGHP